MVFQDRQAWALLCRSQLVFDSFHVLIWCCPPIIKQVVRMNKYTAFYLSNWDRAEGAPHIHRFCCRQRSGEYRRTANPGIYMQLCARLWQGTFRIWQLGCLGYNGPGEVMRSDGPPKTDRWDQVRLSAPDLLRVCDLNPNSIARRPPPVHSLIVRSVTRRFCSTLARRPFCSTLACLPPAHAARRPLAPRCAPSLNSRCDSCYISQLIFVIQANITVGLRALAPEHYGMPTRNNTIWTRDILEHTWI